MYNTINENVVLSIKQYKYHMDELYQYCNRLSTQSPHNTTMILTVTQTDRIHINTHKLIYSHTNLNIHTFTHLTTHTYKDKYSWQCAEEKYVKLILLH